MYAYTHLPKITHGICLYIAMYIQCWLATFKRWRSLPLLTTLSGFLPDQPDRLRGGLKLSLYTQDWSLIVLVCIYVRRWPALNQNKHKVRSQNTTHGKYIPTLSLSQSTLAERELAMPDIYILIGNTLDNNLPSWTKNVVAKKVAKDKLVQVLCSPNSTAS